MSESSSASPPGLDELIREALQPLPEEVRREAARWVERARQASPEEVERELVLESREALQRFRHAAAVVERMIGE